MGLDNPALPTNLGSVVEPKLASDAKPMLTGTLAQQNTHSVHSPEALSIDVQRPSKELSVGATSSRSTGKAQQPQRYGRTDRFPGFTPHTDDIVQAILQRTGSRHPLSEDMASPRWFSNPSSFSPGWKELTDLLTRFRFRPRADNCSRSDDIARENPISPSTSRTLACLDTK